MTNNKPFTLIEMIFSASKRFLPALLIACALAPSAFARENITYPEDITYATTGQAVTFSHKKHVDELGFECADCHSEIFEMKAYSAREKGDFKMEALDDGKYCGHCHNGEKAFGTHDFEQCATCHSGPESGSVEKIPKKIPGPPAPIELGEDDTIAVFRHQAHAELACVRCHTKIFPVKKTKTITTMDDINAGKACGQCHDGKTAFAATECGKCHPKM